MLLDKLLKAIGLINIFEGLTLSAAARALIIASAFAAAPTIHADCLPSPTPQANNVPFYMSTHNDATHAVGYATGTLVSAPSSTAPTYLSTQVSAPQIFSDRWVLCHSGGLGCQDEIPYSQDFDVNQADRVDVTIERTQALLFHPSAIIVSLTFDSWGKAKETFTGVCDASTNLLYGSYANNTMVVISFGVPFNSATQ